MGVHMAERDVAVTFQRLYDVLRAEKDIAKQDIQSLDKSFFADVLVYLREKESMLRDARAKSDMFAAAEEEKLDAQIKNARKLIRELYARREAKIVQMALICAKTRSNIIDTSNLLPEEKSLYESIVSALAVSREKILDTLLSLRLPQGAAACSQQPVDPASSPLRHVRFVEDVEPFVGKELEQYGPYKANDTAQLPPDIAEILVKKGQAIELLEK